MTRDVSEYGKLECMYTCVCTVNILYLEVIVRKDVNLKSTPQRLSERKRFAHSKLRISITRTMCIGVLGNSVSWVPQLSVRTPWKESFWMASTLDSTVLRS